MKKYRGIAALLLLLACLLAGCGSNVEETYANGTTKEQLQEFILDTAHNLEETDLEEARQYAEYYAQDTENEENALYATMLSDWVEARSQAGDYIGTGEFTVDKTGKTLTARQTLLYSVRNIDLVYVFTARNLKVQSINAEPVYTLGETMSRALLNTIMGILIVFLMLVLICLIISCFAFIPKIQALFAKRKKGNTPEEIQETFAKMERDAAASHAAALTSASVPDDTDDAELIAVIAAAIAASEGKSTDSFVVRSIRRRF